MNTIENNTNTSFDHATAKRNKLAKTLWRQWIKENNPTAFDMALYALIRGKSLNKTFSPITNPEKLCNGFSKWQARDITIHRIGKLRVDSFSVFAPLFEEAETFKETNRFETIEYYRANKHPLLIQIIDAINAIKNEENT